ncbi:MAG: hypothetical protein IT166_13950 [Bryobacterales bacterium]|nr:hypothetical protein [Bryobacterales bacterium]
MDRNQRQSHSTSGGKGGLLRFPAEIAAGWDESLPALRGKPILVDFLEDLTVFRRKLYSRCARGTPVHAASFLTARRMVLDSGLLGNQRELRRILIHEVFHFAWVRLGNPRRLDWERLVGREVASHARGELGWSAESRKVRLTSGDVGNRTPGWRQYICESFCDTAAWMFTPGDHEEFTLSSRYRRKRGTWFNSFVEYGPIPL